MMAKSSHKLDKEIIIFMCIIDSGNSRPAELETMITFGECRDATRLCKQPARSFVLRFQQVLSLLLLLMSILLFRHDYRPRQKLGNGRTRTQSCSYFMTGIAWSSGERKTRDVSPTPRMQESMPRFYLDESQAAASLSRNLLHLAQNFS